MSYGGLGDKDIQSPELWQLVLNNVDDLIAVVDLDGRRIYNSPSYKKLFGDIDELQGTDSFQEIHPDDRDRIRRLFSETVRTGVGQQAEFRFLLKDGTVRYIESHGNVIRDASGKLEKVVIISRDITRHRLDREALQRSEQHFRAFFEHSSDIILITDDKYTIVHGSPSIGRVLGYRPEEYLGRSLITLLHPDEVPKVVHTFLMAQESPGAVHPIEHRWQHRLGAWRMFESMCKAVANEHGERTIIINSRDITERNRAEEFLRETNYALQSLIRTSPLAIVATDLEDKVKIWNKAAEHIFGWSEREVLGGSLPIAPKDRTQHPQPLPAPDTTVGTPAETELQIPRKDGSFVDISVWRTALRDASGVAVGTLAFYADITERKQAKEALHESERKFKELVELLPQCVFESDYHGRISFANRYAFELFGYTQDEFHNDLNILQILAPFDHERANDNFQKVLNGERASEAEYTLMRKDGSTFPGIIYSSPIVHHENTVGVRGIIVDITERKRAETTLREAESKFRHLVEQSLVGVYIIQDGKFSYVNPQLAEIFGYEQEEILKSKTVGDLVAEEDRALVGENIRRRIEKEIESVTYGFRGLRKNGSRIDVEVFGSQTEYNGRPAVIGTLLNITERKLAERQLKESEERFRALVEATSDWIWETDCSGVYTYASPKVLELLGYRPDEVIGKTPFDFMDPDEAGRVSALFAAARDKHALFHATENRNRHKDGRVVILETSAVPITDPSGKLQGYRGIDRDVTQRRKAEEEIAQQKEYLQRILDSSLDLVLTIQSDGTVAYANDRLSETMGYTLTEIRGRHFMEFVPESARPALQKRWDELKQGKGGVYETQLQRADGGIVEFLVSISQLKGSDEYLAVLKDITPLKRAEEELGRQKSYFQQLFENSPEAIVILDNADRIISTNRSFAQLFQFSAEEARGSSLNDIIVPQHLLGEASSLSRNVLQGEVIHYETVRKRKDGTLVDVSILGAPIVSGENQIGVYGIYSDITNRKLAEKERARLNSAVEQAAEAIVITDIDATVLYVNPAFERITGYGRDEALGKNPRLLKSGKHGKEFYDRMWSTLLKGDVWSGTITNKRKDGSLYEEEMVISPVRDESARIVNYVAVKRDVTHELEIERQLRQSQKMESLGQLASGIAHDFNNVLGVIGGSLTVLRTRISDSQLERYIDMGETAVSRGADVAKRLLTFSREEEIQLVPISLGSIVDELTKVLASVIEKTVTLSTDIPRDLPLVQGDHGQLYQVLLNLCINARDAILDPRSGKTGGSISINAKTIAGSHLRGRFHEASLEHYIRLSVCDNGTGMTEEVRQRIFDPFFTTKPRGKGTGLGLAVVYGIVKSHLGFIEVESQMGQGSTFHVYLPVHAYEAQISEQRKEETTTGGSETVLVVEDETSLRTLLTELLQMHGYTVITATDGVEALETYTARQSVIAVVISDMGLPKLSGEELVMKIKELNPSARIIIASGYLEPHQRSKLLLAGVKAFVQKPYHGTSILKTMREVLDAKA